MTAMACCILLFAGPRVEGEIEKLATTCENKLCFHWWPKLPDVPGWHHERDSSVSTGSNALAPDGSTFAEAEVVMYAVAVYKPRVPEDKTLDQFISGDKERFMHEDRTLVVATAESLVSADGQSMKSLTFFPSKKMGNWERVTYGEEDEFYLTFTISARSRKAFEAKQADYERLVRSYRK